MDINVTDQLTDLQSENEQHNRIRKKYIKKIVKVPNLQVISQLNNIFN